MLEFLPIVIMAYLGIVVSDAKIVGNSIENTVQWNAIQCNTVQWPLKYNTISYNTIHYWLQYLLQFIMNFHSKFPQFSSVSLHGTSNSYFVVNVWNPDPDSVLRSGGLYEGQGGLWGWKTYPNPRFCTYRSDGYCTPA